jgi:hypothetical protein
VFGVISAAIVNLLFGFNAEGKITGIALMSMAGD